MPALPRLFASYSHLDQRWLAEFRTHLTPLLREAIVDAWDDTRIAPGSKWAEEIGAALAAADIGVLLVTPDYLASDFIARYELPPLLAGTTVFWIAVSHSHHEVTEIAQYQAANDPQRPLDTLEPSERNQAWKAICQNLLRAAERPPASPRPPVARRPKGLWNVPYARNPFFTGREEILGRLRAALTADGATALTQAIRGLGGIGKTQTALEYCYRHRDAYRAVFWVRADTTTDLLADYRRIAALLDLPEQDAQDAAETREAVKRWLAGHEGYLLVLDNADAPALVKAFLPPDPGGHILITSRAHQFARLNVGRAMELPVLPEADAVTFLLRRTDRDTVPPEERAAAVALADELGGLPLALEQAGAYIAVHQSQFQDYLATYRRRQLDLLESQGPEAGDYDKTVATTWSINFDAVQAESPSSAELLRISAFLGPDRIPHELLIDGASQLCDPLAAALKGVGDDPLRLDDLLEPLARYSLIRRDRNASTYDIHRLVQAVIQAGMDSPTRRGYAERAVRVVNQAFPNAEFSKWPVCERLLSHAQVCMQWIERERLEFTEAARLLNLAGYYLVQRAQYSQAEPLHRRALVINERALGPEHPHTATSLSWMAIVKVREGHVSEAESLYRRALAIYEKALPPDHPSLANILDHFAAFLLQTGREAEANELKARAAAIRAARQAKPPPG
jgi:tetratricopeptide (TPR) repeat protein